MRSANDSADPRWVHRSALRSVGVWIWVVGFAFLTHAGWVYWQTSLRAERDVRIVRDSGTSS